MESLSQNIEKPTLEQRAELERRLLRATVKSRQIQPGQSVRACPLSFSQQRLWFLEQLGTGSGVYNVPICLRLSGELNVDVLVRCLNEIVRRHEVLRTGFPAPNGQPVQQVLPSLHLPVPVIDLSGLSDAERNEEMTRACVEEGNRPFELAVAPLFRAVLLQLGKRVHVLQLTMHHIVCDGWSIEIFFREFEALYNAFLAGKPSPLAELPIQYADYAVWQREWLDEAALDQQIGHWRRQLDGAPAALELPTDRPRPRVQRFRGGHQSLELPAPFMEELKRLGQGERATLYMTLFAAFQVLLARYTGQEDVVVGTPIAGRARSDVETLIGCFVNTLVLRTNLSDNPTFRELIGRVRNVALDAFANSDLPFEKLVEELKPQRNTSHGPLLQVLFTMQAKERFSLELSGLQVDRLRGGSQAAIFDLTSYVTAHPDGLTINWEYNTDLFDQATIQRMLEHYRNLLQAIVADPNRRILELPLLSDAERHTMLARWNDTRSPYPRNQCIHELFEEQVERTPDAVAVIFQDRQITYDELNARSNQLAHHLQALGVGPETLAGLCVERSIDMVVGLFGILKAGGAYVPLDPAYPRARLEFMLRDAGVSVLVTQQGLLDSLPIPAECIVHLDADFKTVATRARTNPAGGASPDNLAYVIYTSGSTGQPKGVAIMHQSAVALMSWARTAFSQEELGGVLASTSICFDLSVFEIFMPLCWGGTVILADNALQLPELPAAKRVTLVNTVPSAIAELLRLGDLPPSVRTVCLGGEFLPASLVRQIDEQPGVERVLDLYGPTEDTVYSTLAHRKAGGQETIGRPIANKQAYVLDGQMQPVPIGVAGELFLGGVGLARGYLNAPEMTAQKFLRHPFSDEPQARVYRTGDRVRWLPDGSLEFLGRLDHQVKIRGFRIELGEIETVLNRHSEIQSAVVVSREDGAGDKRLVAYVVPERKPAPPVGELRSFVKQALPDHMVPSSFVTLDALPLTVNGKVDRRALPLPEDPRPKLEHAYVEPRTQVERRLAAIWSEVLGTQRVGRHDNFFALGGHSLLAVRVFARIEREFGCKLPLVSLFQRATIAELADLVRSPHASPNWNSIVPLQTSGSRPPLFLMHNLSGELLYWRPFVKHLGLDRPIYGFQPPALRDPSLAPIPDLESLAADYVEQLCAMRPTGPYYLAGYSFGGRLSLEIAQQLIAMGKAVDLLAIIDTGHAGSRATSFSGHLAAMWAILRNVPHWLVDDLLQTSPRAFFGRVYRKSRVIGKRVNAGLTRGSGPALLELEDVLDPVLLTDRHYPIIEANYGAWRRYKPSPYPGRITLLKAHTRPLFHSYGPDLGWGEVAQGGVDVRVVPGHHWSVMREPHVAALSKALNDVLIKVDEAGSGKPV